MVTVTRHKTTREQVGKTEYTGPYQTLGAAKGMLTRLLDEYNHYYGSKSNRKDGWVERTTGAWEEVTE